MRHEMAMTKNVKRLLAAVREVENRPLGMEGGVLLWGEPGEGKSTTIAYATNMMNGIFLRAMRTWSVTSMLGALSIELGLEKMRYRAPMMEAAVEKLMEYPRPVFVDEADYLMKGSDMLDTLRDIYDLTGSPVVLIGMEEMARKIQRRGRFARRITQWIELRGLDIGDTRVVADTVCEVGVAGDLLSRLHKAARGNVGRIVLGLAKIEQFGKTNGLETVTSKDWGRREFFYDQPRFTKRRRR